MSNWWYSEKTPTVNFRNAMTIPRDLSLKHNGSHIFLASAPSPEIYAARASSKTYDLSKLEGTYTVGEILPENKGAYEIDFTVTPGADNNLTFRLYNSKGEQMLYTFDFEALTLNLDRSQSGIVDFDERFPKKDILTHLVKKDSYEVKVFVDRHSVELFVNDGDLTFTNTMFPTEVYNSMDLASADAAVSGLTIYELK
jgi:fructan beta-fructosidase